MPATQPQGDKLVRGRRGVARARLHLPARLILLDGYHDCVLENLSVTGAQLSLANKVQVKSTGFLECEQLDAFCEVVWSAGQRIGVHFDEPQTLETIIGLRWFADGNPRLVKEQVVRFAEEWVKGGQRADGDF